MTPDEACRALGVSRETAHRLIRFAELLAHWNRRINLVSAGSLDHIWVRHIADSLQLLDLAPDDARTWVDLGSGGGLPAIPVALAALDTRPGLAMTLIESDQRKAAFLATAVRELGVAATVLAQRIESVPAAAHDVISARALAPLPRLLELASRFAGPETVLLFPKGTRADSELTAAEAAWHIRAERIASRTEPGAAILRIRELRGRR
jgi:16S rRNA (guanine527-N7)-methyltransferase